MFRLRATFSFSAEEREFFQSKGYTNEPKRCPSCRLARKTERYGNSGSGYRTRQMFPVRCAECGKDTEVPLLNPEVTSRFTVAIATAKPDQAGKPGQAWNHVRAGQPTGV